MDAIEPREITKELQESYLDYAMSVIVSRALPDVRDGLKPVHRRVLWTMWETGLTHLAKYRKSANVVGATMGNYHPHGDTAIYDTMVRMAQDFSLRYPLIQGQGNWGDVDGDGAAAMRYCITGDTLVVTEKGLLPIKQISENAKEDIKIKILSKDKIVNEATKWFDSGEHPTLKITTRNGFALQGTGNHPILTWTKDSSNGEPSFRWKLLEEIKEGDVAVIDRTPDALWPEKSFPLQTYEPHPKNPRIEKKIFPTELTDDLASILGALLSEGTIKEHELEFCNSDSAWIEDFKSRWHKTFPDCRLHHFHRPPSSYGKKPYETFEIHSHYVIEFLRNIGLVPGKSKTKRIPFAVLQSSETAAAAFLRAYFEGDGSISSSGEKMIELSCCSVSEELIQDLQTLLLRFGIVGTKRFDLYRNTHKLYIRGLKNYILFREKIGFVSERKKQKLEEAIARLHKDYSQNDFVPFISTFTRANVVRGNRTFITHHNFDRYAPMEKNHTLVIEAIQSDVRPFMRLLFEKLLEQNYLFDPILKIEKKGVERVYSIRVDSECHSFVANGFVNHNTECRLSRIAEELLFDIEKETVGWQPNYDSTRQEPKVLPAKLPNLLLNGSLGIAVGMTTNIPPHNLGEIVDAILFLADNPDATSENLTQFVKGPDFPTGGTIFDEVAIKACYSSGRGGITTRAKAEIVERKSNRQFDIVITEIPYQVNKAELIKTIAQLHQDKKVEGIRDIRDESDREGMRIVIELKNDAPPQKVLNQLYEHSDLQKDFHLNMIALVNGIEPQLLSLRDILSEYVKYRKEVIRKRTQFDLRKAEERAHILEGLSRALDAIDKVIATIKKSEDKDDAHKNLIKNFKLSAIQATAILEMRLQTLAALEREKIEAELKEKLALIKELGFILKSPAKILKIIKDELAELKEKYGDERRTKVVPTPLKVFSNEDLIQNEDAIITYSAGGYVKRLPPDTFKSQRRGGKGLIGSDVAEEDFLSHFFSAETHDNILFFTDKGRVFQTKVYEIPASSRTSKGKAIHNFLELPTDENVSAIVSYADKRGLKTRISADTTEKNQRESASHLRESAFLVMVTKNGVIKKTSLDDFLNIRRSGIIAIRLQKGDLLKWVRLSGGKDEIILTTKLGQSIRFKESYARPMGRAAAGVRGIRLKKADEVAGFDVIKEVNAKVLVVMANGFAKQTALKEYRLQSRGGSGIKTANITPKTGHIVSAHITTDEEEIFALSAKGQMIRTDLKSVRTTGRSAQGVKIMNLNQGDRLAGTVII